MWNLSFPTYLFTIAAVVVVAVKLWKLQFIGGKTTQWHATKNHKLKFHIAFGVETTKWATRMLKTTPDAQHGIAIFDEVEWHAKWLDIIFFPTSSSHAYVEHAPQSYFLSALSVVVF